MLQERQDRQGAMLCSTYRSNCRSGGGLKGEGGSSHSPWRDSISFFVFDWTMVHHDQIAGDIIAVFWPHSPALEVCQRAQIGFSFPPTRCVYRLWSFKLME